MTCIIKFFKNLFSTSKKPVVESPIVEYQSETLTKTITYDLRDKERQELKEFEEKVEKEWKEAAIVEPPLKKPRRKPRKKNVKA